MLAFLGFLTIILVLALIMSKKSSTLIALIIIPAITGFITAFIKAPQTIIDAAAQKAADAGTEFVAPVVTFGDRLTQDIQVCKRLDGLRHYQHRCYRRYVHLCDSVLLDLL